ncbi:MAG TPA: hypothetical protein DEF18_15005 [Muricauda sp.]|nr:hypothetical protein [Allomuricauda sp.]HBU79404.1 hypothetical protein [Allomuricauda sp.]
MPRFTKPRTRLITAPSLKCSLTLFEGSPVFGQHKNQLFLYLDVVVIFGFVLLVFYNGIFFNKTFFLFTKLNLIFP